MEHIDAIEVVDRETDEPLAHAVGERARELYASSGLLQALEVTTNEEGERVIRFPVVSGVFQGPGQYANYQNPAENEERGMAKEQLMLDLFNGEEVGQLDCFNTIINPPFDNSDFYQVMDYLQIPHEIGYTNIWNFRRPTHEEMKERLLSTIMEHLELENDDYAEALDSYFLSHEYDPRTWQPSLTLENLQSIVFPQMLSSCEGYRQWLRDPQGWPHSLYLHLRNSPRGRGRERALTKNELWASGYNFVKDILAGRLEGGRKRIQTRRKGRKGTRRGRRRAH